MLKEYRDEETGKFDWSYWWLMHGETVQGIVVGTVLFGTVPFILLLNWAGVIHLSEPDKPKELTHEERFITSFDGTYTGLDRNVDITIDSESQKATFSSDERTTSVSDIKVVGESISIYLPDHKERVQYRLSEGDYVGFLIPNCGETRCTFYARYEPDQGDYEPPSRY